MAIKKLQNFEDVVRRHQREIVNFHYRLVGNFFEAEDLAQDTFIKAYKKFDTLNDNNKTKSWLFSIARNVTVDFFRKKKLNTISLDNVLLENYLQENQVNYHAEAINNEVAKELEACINKLDRIDRTIIRLLYYEGFSYKEISIMLNIKQNTLKSRLHRARKALLAAIKSNEILKDLAVTYS